MKKRKFKMEGGWGRNFFNPTVDHHQKNFIVKMRSGSRKMRRKLSGGSARMVITPPRNE